MPAVFSILSGRNESDLMDLVAFVEIPTSDFSFGIEVIEEFEVAFLTVGMENDEL
jgi:hypothetical protein